jgi:hypothetical protein
MTYIHPLDRGMPEGTRVMPERTEVVWTYRPPDFFEAPYRHRGTECDLLIEAGKAVAILRVAQDPVDAQIEDSIRKLVEGACAIRQLQVHRRYDLEGPTIYQHTGGRQDVAIRIGGTAAMATFAGQLDITISDAAGNFIRDTKAERIAEDTSMLDLLAPKLVHSSSLRSAVTSYSRSVSDPSNELVHLYEVRDALQKHYGNEDKARLALNITKPEWQRLGVLANVEPLEQGRHRGNHAVGRRSATESELQEAREIVCRWIIAFGRVV